MKLAKEKHPVGTRFIMITSGTSVWEAVVQEWSKNGHVRIEYSYGQSSWFTATNLPEIEEVLPEKKSSFHTTRWSRIKQLFN